MAPNPHVDLHNPLPSIIADVDLTRLDMSVVDLDNEGGERKGDGACDMSIVDLSSEEDADVIMLSPKTVVTTILFFDRRRVTSLTFFLASKRSPENRTSGEREEGRNR